MLIDVNASRYTHAHTHNWQHTPKDNWHVCVLCVFSGGWLQAGVCVRCTRAGAGYCRHSWDWPQWLEEQHRVQRRCVCVRACTCVCVSMRVCVCVCVSYRQTCMWVCVSFLSGFGEVIIWLRQCWDFQSDVYSKRTVFIWNFFSLSTTQSAFTTQISIHPLTHTFTVGVLFTKSQPAH